MLNIIATTSCGKKVGAVGLEYFDVDYWGFTDYLMELNEIGCGERGEVNWVGY